MDGWRCRHPARTCHATWPTHPNDATRRVPARRNRRPGKPNASRAQNRARGSKFVTCGSASRPEQRPLLLDPDRSHADGVVDRHASTAFLHESPHPCHQKGSRRPSKAILQQLKNPVRTYKKVWPNAPRSKIKQRRPREGTGTWQGPSTYGRLQQSTCTAETSSVSLG